LARVNLVGQRAVFLVLARLQLLVGVAFDLLLLRFDIEFEPFAVGLDLSGARLEGFELALGGGGLGAKTFAFGAEMGEFSLHATNFLVAVLQQQQLLNRLQHCRLETSRRNTPSQFRRTMGVVLIWNPLFTT